MIPPPRVAPAFRSVRTLNKSWLGPIKLSGSSYQDPRWISLPGTTVSVFLSGRSEIAGGGNAVGGNDLSEACCVWPAFLLNRANAPRGASITTGGFWRTASFALDRGAPRYHIADADDSDWTNRNNDAAFWSLL
jgi:hypothetical protein